MAGERLKKGRQASPDTWVLLCGALALALVLLAAALWYPPLAQKSYVAGDGAPFAEIHPEDKVDVNSADIHQLCLLPGIGEKKAQAIIDHRQQHGDFASLEDLGRVSGIGPKILSDIEELITF
ncbi:ComEA family DNA-binding protein [Clostridia bacterium OttesenSCG-928-O13]|nr:ComEA family DNA-binding protein [Clostridia bacterium OttesenSCG-928-O13]